MQDRFYYNEKSFFEEATRNSNQVEREFFEAIRCGDEATVIALLTKKIDISIKQFEHALQIAMLNDHFELFKSLQHLHPQLINYDTIFEDAINCDKAEIVLFLLSLEKYVGGAKIFDYYINEKMCHEGFLTACQQGKIKVVEAMLQDQEQVQEQVQVQEIEKKRIDINKVFETTVTIEEESWTEESNYLIEACYAAQASVVTLLLKYIDPTLLNYAALIKMYGYRTNHPDIDQALLNHEKIDPSFLSGLPLRMACERGYDEIVKKFLAENKVNPAMGKNLILRNVCHHGKNTSIDLLLNDPRVNPDISFFKEDICQYNKYSEMTHTVLKKISHTIKLTADDYFLSIIPSCTALQPVILEFLLNASNMQERFRTQSPRQIENFLASLFFAALNVSVNDEDRMRERQAKVLLVISHQVVMLMKNAFHFTGTTLPLIKEALDHIITLSFEKNTTLMAFKNFYSTIKKILLLINPTLVHNPRGSLGIKKDKLTLAHYLNNKEISTDVRRYLTTTFGSSMIDEMILCESFGQACLEANVNNVSFFKSCFTIFEWSKLTQRELRELIGNNISNFMPKKQGEKFGGSNDCFIDLLDVINIAHRKNRNILRKFFNYLLLIACDANAIKIARHLVLECGADPSYANYSPFLLLLMNLNKHMLHQTVYYDREYDCEYTNLFNDLLITLLKDERVNRENLLASDFEPPNNLRAIVDIPKPVRLSWLEKVYPIHQPKIVEAYQQIKRETDAQTLITQAYLKQEKSDTNPQTNAQINQAGLFEKYTLLSWFASGQATEANNNAVNSNSSARHCEERFLRRSNP